MPSDKIQEDIGAYLVGLTVALAILKMLTLISIGWFWVCLPALLTLPWWAWLMLDFDDWG